MKRYIFLENMSGWGKLLLFIGLIIISSLFSAFTGLLIGKIFFGLDLNTIGAIVSDPKTSEAITFVKIYQLINQIGVFIIPVVLFGILISPNVVGYLDVNKTPKLIALLISGLVVYTILPFNHYLLELNQSIRFPEVFSAIENWMLEYESRAKVITESFLKTDSISVLLVNLFIVAIVPAIGEEWMFRGVLLKLFKQITANSHWAIIITAFLFAAFHLQFLSFLPRFLLGILLGYMYLLTKNLWIPVFAHFVNNASSVVIFYLHYNGKINISLDDFGSSQGTVYIIGSLLITIWLMFILSGKERQGLNP